MTEINPIYLALAGTGGTFFLTALGASVVFFFRREMSEDTRRIFLGFAAGIMIAASVWSLLIPAIEMTEDQGGIGWVPAAGGFILGGVFLWLLDRMLPHLHGKSEKPEGISSHLKRTTLLVFAVTLHNIPEGLAVGLTFGLAAQGNSNMTFASAIVLAVGIGLQNFPEGAAISIPLRQEGLSRTKAFLYGAASGVVEPVAGVLGVILVGSITGIMPWMLAMAAGAMIYVVVEELVPEACLGEHSHKGTGGVMVGFLIMMIMDVALG